MDQVDVVVVGAGVVGLACARALAMAGHEVVILEALHAHGQVTSARNSEVIHAGLYYPTGSLKARLCVEGRRTLYAFCEAHQVPHRRLGKLIVAADGDEVSALERLFLQAQANGVEGLSWLSGAQARALEPALAAHVALLSESTGIVDSHALMASLLGAAQDHGAMLALQSALQRARALAGGGFELAVGGDEPMALRCRALINAAGLSACAVARRIEGLAPVHVPQAFQCKGHYFALSGKAPFSRLIYPVPQQAGLGIHYTLDMGGQGRFGPDVQWLDDGGSRANPLAEEAPIDYSVPESARDRFEEAVRRYWPGLPEGSLSPAYSGVRPKIVPPGAPAADFLVQGPQVHGLPGLVNLFGIESPGLTACLALADEVQVALQKD